MNQLQAPQDSLDSVASSAELKEANREIERLRKELDNSKNKQIIMSQSHTEDLNGLENVGASTSNFQFDLEELKSEMRSLREEIQDAKTKGFKMIPPGSEISSENRRGSLNSIEPSLNNEFNEASEKLNKLKEEFSDSTTSDYFRNSDNSMRSLYSFGGEEPPDLTDTVELVTFEAQEGESQQILMLQKELARTKRELDIANTNKFHTSMTINARYEELTRLSGACLDKDREITTLRKDVEILKKELSQNNSSHSNKKVNFDAETQHPKKTTASALTESGASALTDYHDDSSLGSDDSASFAKDEMDMAFWKFWGRKSMAQKSPSKLELEKEQEKEEKKTEEENALKSLVDMLQSELATTGSELNATKRELEELKIEIG